MTLNIFGYTDEEWKAIIALMQRNRERHRISVIFRREIFKQDRIGSIIRIAQHLNEGVIDCNATEKALKRSFEDAEYRHRL